MVKKQSKDTKSKKSKPKKAENPAVKKASKPADRKVEKTKPKSRRKHRKELRNAEREQLGVVSSSLEFAKATAQFIRSNGKVIGRMMGVYALLYFVLARSVPEFGIRELNEYLQAEQLVESEFSRVTVLLDVALTGSQSSAISVFYGLILWVATSLAMLWSARALKGGRDITARDGYYRGLTGFVPYILVWCMIALQMLPFAIGAFIYSVAAESIAVVGAELAFFVFIWLILSVPTVYWLSTSLLATVVASVPGYYPMRSLEIAREIVGPRRAMMIRRLLGGALVYGAIFLASILFSIIVLPWAVYIVRDVALVLAPFIFNIYLFHLYRELIDEA